jgi:hypothetical protein
MSVRFTINVDDHTYAVMLAVRKKTGRSLSDQARDHTRNGTRKESEKLHITPAEIDAERGEAASQSEAGKETRKSA